LRGEFADMTDAEIKRRSREIRDRAEAEKNSGNVD